MSTNTSIFSILRNIHLINLFNLGILKKEAHNIFLGICPPNIPIIRHMVSRCQVYPILGQNIGSWIPYRPHRMKKLYAIYFSLLVTPFDVNIPLLSQPNPITTQQQLNLTRLRLDTIITLNPHHPTHPTHHKPLIGWEDSGMIDRGFSLVESSYSYH